MTDATRSAGAASRLIALAILTTLLSGCAGWGISGRDDGERWSLAGKLGMRKAGQAESVLLNWVQCEERYRLTLSGPFGQQLARVQGDAAGATFWLRDAEPEFTAAPQAWLDQRLGWPLPISQLRHWVRGRAAVGPVTAVRRDSDGNAALIEQGGWQVEYLEYHSGAQLDLPRRLRASRNGMAATLVVRQWRLGEEVETCPAA